MWYVILTENVFGSTTIIGRFSTEEVAVRVWTVLTENGIKAKVVHF